MSRCHLAGPWSVRGLHIIIMCMGTASVPLSTSRLTPMIGSLSHSSTASAVSASTSRSNSGTRGCGRESHTPPGGSSGPASRRQISRCRSRIASQTVRTASSSSAGMTLRRMR